MEEDSDIITRNFPSLDEFDLFDVNGPQKPKSDWANVKIGTFQAKIEMFKASRQHMVRRTNTTPALFEEGIPLHQLTSLANASFGYDGWSTELVDTKVLTETITGSHDESLIYSYVVESHVRLILKDGTVHQRKGTGRAVSQPIKSMAISKAKKESVTSGIKACLESLNTILIVHEEKLRKGYYCEGYDDIFYCV